SCAWCAAGVSVEPLVRELHAALASGGGDAHDRPSGLLPDGPAKNECRRPPARGDVVEGGEEPRGPAPGADAGSWSEAPDRRSMAASRLSGSHGSADRRARPDAA